MKITITNHNKTYSTETDEDVDAENLADMFKGLMVNMGYHPSNVDELFNTEYRWFTQEEIDNNRQGHLKNSSPFMDSFKENHSNKTEQKMVDNKAEEWQNDLYKERESESAY